MKRISLCLLVTTVLLFISIAGLFNIKKVTENLSVMIDEIISDISAENFESAINKTKIAKDYWEENTVFSFIYINQNKLLNVSSSFAKISGLIKENSDEVISECLSLKTHISLIYHTELPILENIF